MQSCTFWVSNVGRGMNGKENNPNVSLLFERNVMLLATKLFSMWTKTSCCVYHILQNTAHSIIISKWDFPSNKCPLFKQTIFYAKVKHWEIFLVRVMLMTLESHQASMLKKENVNGKFWSILPFWFLRVSYRFSPPWSLIMTDVCGAEFTYIIVSNRDRERIFITAEGGRRKTWCWTRREEQSSVFFVWVGRRVSREHALRFLRDWRSSHWNQLKHCYRLLWEVDWLDL